MFPWFYMDNNVISRFKSSTIHLCVTRRERVLSIYFMLYVFFLSRELAESSPYLEAFAAKDTEVLYCYEPYDELVLMNLAQFDKKKLKSIENQLSEESKGNENVEEKFSEDGRFLNRNRM